MSDKALFDPFTLYDGLCTFAILVGSMIAAGGGLGGGGVFVPIYILVLSFNTKHAAALSQATILGGSIVNLIMNWKARHPSRPHRPLTDFPTLLVFEPMLLVGTVIGVYFNVMFPAMLILILLIVTLVYATFRTTRKGYNTWQQESELLNGPSISGYITNGAGPASPKEGARADDAHILQGYDTKDSDKSDGGVDATVDDDLLGTAKSLIQLTDTGMADYDDAESLIKKRSTSYGSVGSDHQEHTIYSSEYDPVLWSEMARMTGVKTSDLDRKKIDVLQPLMEKEKQKWIPMAIVGFIWIISSSTSIGKNNSISGVEACSVLYWAITFISFPILMAISLFYAKQQHDLHDQKERTEGWRPAEGDIEWNSSMMNMAKYPLIATVAGLLGGLLGIGGGMIVSPLLMELGVKPTVAAATSAMAVLITSSSATLQFVLLGYLNLDYTFYFMAIGVIGTFIGQTVVNYAIRYYGRRSLIIFSVAAIMAGAVVLMGIDGIMQLINGISWAFTAPC
mmetsp:Transcript_73611/g.117355  ORF Transcript_73611/g.117355 Transcript_73611/m.117355 type:complete len:509 (+) Transcript_73611:85-1611(+)|eukprot:CAMPEP_0197040336 /NCGR_PEP_ID=MMETSP1384-20130603/17065_1 /TAXON_ID=29189 /ORGANISM="Ammonia sp." /LENGTH=508 /DNA_ID=CAMNT_0042471077 /DNA_START=70 /DNA_END=1596 /DNA_ORIENTATION=-